jgi:hypothetical protein
VDLWWLRGRQQGRRSVPRRGAEPFSFEALAKEELQAIAFYNDGADIAQTILLSEAPKALRVIVGFHYGWDAVAGPYRMDHEEFLYALQVIGDANHGVAERRALRQENAVASQNTQNLERANARIQR